MPGTLNMWSGVRNQAAFNVVAPAFANLIVGYQYAITIMNSTDNDVATGTMIVMGADAKPDDPCAPDVFAPLIPVADCQPILTGVPYGPQVEITIDATRPIPAHGICSYAVPCPKQFMQVSGIPAGCTAVCFVTRLRRTDWTHLGPYGTIPPPLQLMAPFQAPLSQPLQPPQPAAVPRQRA